MLFRLARWWKQLWCDHDYEPRWFDGVPKDECNVYTCSKCDHTIVFGGPIP